MATKTSDYANLINNYNHLCLSAGYIYSKMDDLTKAHLRQKASQIQGVPNPIGNFDFAQFLKELPALYKHNPLKVNDFIEDFISSLSKQQFDKTLKHLTFLFSLLFGLVIRYQDKPESFDLDLPLYFVLGLNFIFNSIIAHTSIIEKTNDNMEKNFFSDLKNAFTEIYETAFSDYKTFFDKYKNGQVTEESLKIFGDYIKFLHGGKSQDFLMNNFFGTNKWKETLELYSQKLRSSLN